jgi:hypothetical protein
MPFPTFGRKQAFISSDIRRLRIGRLQQRGTVVKVAGADLSPDLQGLANEGCSLLFLDDVLTSGGTLLREFESFTTSNRVPVLQQPAKAHILTLFRTPVRSTSESHHL